MCNMCVMMTEIQIIEGDQKDAFPLWEIHIKKEKKTFYDIELVLISEIFSPPT